MSLWSFVSSIVWEEAASPPARAAPAPPSATGAPGYVRKAVRFVLTGTTAMVLTAQVAGIRLAAPVDADPSYCVVQSEQCKKACPTGFLNAACVKACNEQRQKCRRDEA